MKEAPLGEVLRAAVRYAKAPSLYPCELNMLADIALCGDDRSGPVLDNSGTVRQAQAGYVPELNLPDDVQGIKAKLLGSHLFVFIATGWLKPVEGAAHDGAYQLNIARLKRLLDLTEVKLAAGEYDPKELEEADREHSGDFNHTPPEDLTEQIDRILVSNPAI